MRTPKWTDLTLIEVFPDWKTGELFSQLNSPPWAAWNITGVYLDWEYFANRSGDKLISPLIHRLLTDGELSTLDKAALVTLIKDKFYPQWEKLFSTYNLQYNPLNNFSQTKHTEETHGDTFDGTYTKGTTDTRTLDTQDERTIEHDMTESADRSAYNASTYSPVDKVTTDEDTGDTTTHTGTDTVVHSGEDTEGTTNEGSYTIDETKNGASGSYMLQDMIRKDRELWQENYFEHIFNDLDSLLTLPIYPAENHQFPLFFGYGYPNI